MVIENAGQRRRFEWVYPNPPADLDGFEIRYGLGTLERPWSEMALFAGATSVTRSIERQEPPDGTYTFGIVAKDTSGNPQAPVAPLVVYRTVVFDQGAFGVPVYVLNAESLGWPGTKTQCFVEAGALVADDTTTWDELPAWNDWPRWRFGYLTPITYEHPVIDLGSISSRRLRISSIQQGPITITVSTSNDDITYSAWVAPPTVASSYRYIKLKAVVAGATPTLQSFSAVFYA